MSTVNITKIESLPIEARDFVDFLRDLVTNSPEFINAFLPELEKRRFLEYTWEYKGESYLNEYLIASEEWSNGYKCDGVNELISDFIESNGACGFSGAFRMVIVFEGCDYVIKFPIRSKDCCLIECENYKAAVEAGLGHYFVNTYNLGPLDFFKEKGYNGNIYIQKRIHRVVEDVDMNGYLDEEFWSYGPEDEYGDHYFKDDYFDEEVVDDFVAFVDEWYMDMLNYRGILFQMWFYRPTEELIKLNDFLEHNHINDIHPRNAGFLTSNYDTYPVIIDFAGC